MSFQLKQSILIQKKYLYKILIIITIIITGHLILCDGVISHNWPQMASDGTIWGKLHNSQKNA